MKRREFVASVVASGLAAPAFASDQHDHGPISGPLAHAVVGFGAWKTEPPFDRMTQPPAPPRNAHLLFPHEAKIKAGGAVSFVISGLHNVQIFAPGTQPSSINTSLTTPMTGPAPFTGLPIINDPTARVYRGPDPSLLPLDRVEVVQLSAPGKYLVICGFLFHFQDNMFGYVTVLR
jgi:hypothetical protein